MEILACVFAVYVFTIVTAAELSISANQSVYPGEDASFICSINTSTLDNIMFQWTRFLSDGASDVVTLPEDADNSIGSAASSVIRSTYNITNVNYTNNGIGLQCSTSDNTSDITYLTVLTPIILTIPMSPVTLQVGDAINLTCGALGGPRLMLSWLKDGTEIVSSKMGIDVLNFAMNTTDDCDFGNYTCIATIDDMYEFYTVLVVPTADSDTSENEQSCQAAVITLTIFLIITVIGLVVSVVINILQRKNVNIKKCSFFKGNTADTEINLSTLPVTTESKSNLVSEPIYEGIPATTIKAEPDYVGINVNTEPNYEGVTDDFNLETEPEYIYEPVTGYKRQDTDSAIYVNTVVNPSQYANSS